MLVSCGPIKNYDHPLEPFYEGNFAVGEPEFRQHIKIVTWNLNFAKNINSAIETLSGVQELANADIILLQEMDEIGVERIAKELAYNYVYYPASIHPRHNKNFGNAVLSKWKIIDHEKINLPKTGPGKKHSRNAVKAKIRLSDIDINAFSVHLETFWIMQPENQRQAAFLVKQISGNEDILVIGGDFNSLTQGSIKYLEQSFGQAGLQRLTKDTGHTFEDLVLKLTLDHIFASKVELLESGVWRGSDASDHFPLWSVIKVN